MEFRLKNACEVAFQCIAKRKFPNISHFHTTILRLPLILQTDVSKKGLGAVHLQNSKPVMFASRALTGSERNY